jgi:hypothetical protein
MKFERSYCTLADGGGFWSANGFEGFHDERRRFRAAVEEVLGEPTVIDF